MDIARLPVTPQARVTAASNNGVSRTAQTVEVEPVEAVDARPRSRARFENVIQGELLQRDPVLSQSTRSFLNERAVDQARPAGQLPGPAAGPRAAVGQYLNHVRPEPVSELTQGRSINFFV